MLTCTAVSFRSIPLGTLDEPTAYCTRACIVNELGSRPPRVKYAAVRIIIGIRVLG